jgi:protein SHQ1
LNELDIFIDENDFRFYCKPYYLRLNLPGSILENNDNVDYNFEESKSNLIFKN